MKVYYKDTTGVDRSQVAESVEEIYDIIDLMNNELQEFVSLVTDSDDSFTLNFTLIGPNEGRVVAICRKNSSNVNELSKVSRLIDHSMIDSDVILDIGYHGGSDPTEIYKTVPIAVAKVMVAHYFEHRKITNLDHYKWEGDIKPE